MLISTHVAIGSVLAIAGWLAARSVAAAWRFRPISVVALDGLAPAAYFTVLLAATAKPIFAGAVVFALFAGFAFLDRTKRRVLREPVVFTDIALVRELFRHPELYLPFAGTGRVVIGAASALCLFAALFIFDPPIFLRSAALAVAAFGTPIAITAIAMTFMVEPYAMLMRRFGASGDPVSDAGRLGPLASLAIYGAIARAERAPRRARASPGASAVRLCVRSPVILVQSESFFDVRRLHSSLPRTLLPAFDVGCRTSFQWGRLSVPCWGANTTRTEFQVLTGLSDGAVGFDRFNPYHAFARAAVDSLAWALKSEGYRTVCVHPFDPCFYDRHRIMPNLGFDKIIGEDAFAGSDRVGRYVSDVAVARHCSDLLSEHSSTPIFLFVITMENHGPWLRAPTAESAAELGPDLRALPEAGGFGHYLHSLRNADTMLSLLTEVVRRDGRSGILGFYGDHLPSFPAVFSRLGFEDTWTDYLLWRPNAMPQQRRDIAAHELATAILSALRQPTEVAAGRV